MTGYVRVDTSNNIADGNVISAADLDNEFDGIQAAFNASTGHNHDGTTGEGAPISVLGPTQDVVVGASTVTPKTTNTVDVGSSSLKFKDLYLAGNASIGGTLGVTGATTLSAALTYGGVTLSNAVTGTGNMVLSASPTLTGTLSGANASLSGTLAVTGVVTLTAQPILSSLTASRAVFTDGSKGLVSNAITGTGNVVMSASPTLTGTITAEALTTSSTVTLNGGTANGVAYLNGSKVLTTGSALTFDGSVLTLAPNQITLGSSTIFALGSSSYFKAASTNGFLVNNSADTLNFFKIDTSGNAIFYPAGSEQMRLTSTGLGIGTSSPGAKLDVNGAGIVRGFLTATDAMKFGGNTSAPSSTDAFIYRPADNTLAFGTASAEKMRLDSSGNLGLGVTPSGWSLSGLAAMQVKNGGLYGYDLTEVGVTSNAYYGSSSWRYISSAQATRFVQVSGQHQWFTAPSGTAGDAISFTQAMDLANSGGASTLTVNSAINTASAIRLTTNGGLTAGLFLAAPTVDHSLGFQTAGSERARITSGGDFLVGTTVAPTGASTSGLQLRNVSGAIGRIDWGKTTSGTQTGGSFYHSGTQVGTITYSDTATAYNTSSDYRLKNITGPITTSGAYIDSLNPVEGTWKADGSTFVGLIAHEVQEASRTQVATGVKDGEQMQGMDYSSAELIANMLAELKSLRARVAALESI